MANTGVIPKVRAGSGPDSAAAVANVTDLPDPPSPEDALVGLFQKVRDELLSTLMYLLGNRDDAQDAAQEAFLKCWRNRHQVHEIRDLRAWVFRVALNTAKDYQRSAWHRKTRPLPEDEVMLPGYADWAGQHVEDQETLERLRRAITHLRPEEKEVFLLRQNGELTYEQIAEIRNVPVGTVKTQMRSALMKLRQVLNPEAGRGD
ncbi:MAG: RNA polymerase sigma factor [Thermogemmata sp.]|jgi:RNA polymerase sigma-70 factor (ECF subfamily)|uniref:RNA polymerase sigma factor n=1 Tax=Thermogemmata fonticola TaxID=2755323 RepID=A0A7V8VCL8_9BACT|nr:RNA polymerase sigma factor [Thermogemmata fonticola]MBA2225572.1 RNA polymerase sigma factor [Thermogemmata fonticola]MCX8140286.1 RNA polymerase sigma factor [Gemmataceae bacterium]GIW83611.1 MAG: RNA polymerase sigma factor [Gemmataceae bacterium]